ncbi:NACHT and WD repeat domain-containing protein 2 [Folsomia candida]|uniref:NACHT and WD repeat domain-containing protein 2 n=1 Tax=Folsomia candida TaxID=158441 RepID=A0A226F4Y7_FOLCA|nr:NACHT and WD repeat domain-containing protein 2 [Folsomia candida]
MWNQQDHQFPELCLGELQRQLEVSYVVPVLFLSNSLGESLLPKTVEQQDFEMSLKNVGDVESRSLLETWYEIDTHAEPPCYRLKPVSAHLPKVRSTTEEEKNQAINQWRGIVEQILGIFLRVFPAELRDTYLTTVIEQEIHNSIFMSREVGKRSVWCHRVFTQLPAGQDANDSTPLTKEKSRRLEALHNELKNQLSTSHILRLLVKWEADGLSQDNAEHAAYLQELSGQLSTQLKSILDDIIEEDKGKAVWKSSYGVDGLLCSELMQHTIFCQQSANTCSIPLENTLSAIKQYIASDKSYPLVVHGVKGCGKTCLISRAVQQCLNWFPDALIVYRFVALTPESSTLVQILRTVVNQLTCLITGRTFWIPHNVDCYRKELFKLVSSSPQASSIIIIIDGIDELDPLVVSELSCWLSEEMPSRMKIIMSCSEASEDTSVFQIIKASLKHEDAFISVPNPNQTAAEGLLTATLLQYCHSADGDLQKKISSRLKHCTLPLYIKVLAWQASIGSVDLSGTGDTRSVINDLFDYLEKSLGKEKVEYTLALLCASRYGLCDSEILDLLAHSPTFCSSVTHLDWAPASLFLAQLCQSLGPFLEWGSAGGSLVIRWRDQLMSEIAKERYLGKGETSKKTRKLLLDYFKSNWKDKKNGRFQSQPSEVQPGNSYQRRKLEEIPVQEFHLDGSIKKSYLCNLKWLVEKLQGSSVYNVIEDIVMESKGDTANLDADLSLLLKVLEMSANALSYDGSQFFGQIYGRLQSLIQSNSPDVSKCSFMKKVYEECEKPRVPSFVPLSSTLLHNPHDLAALLAQESKSFQELGAGEVYFDQITRLKSGNEYVVSLSTSNEEVIVWDVNQAKPVRTLRGVPNPNDLKIIDNTRVVLLCGRELQIFNLDDGSFVSKMKGIMNQKMPYYSPVSVPASTGLHDEHHIVSLSRNRMYVNLMNLTSGECISTFKVGEDRFLNSLIVSENGKILVCGDETQKPFPLLVWDLNSKKLIYDLRIPHHEFVTNLSAITKEGHFVCCVCREVDDPGPNFIVVYDLQSGTLFKKWKPGYSTHAIAISAQGGCVINSLEDNRILVWDLVTGACKHSLHKHTAPADTLLLDHTGARCLSYDSIGRDRTVCLWDLATGTLFASFTPDLPYSACEVSNDGCGVVFGFKGRRDVATILYRTEQSEEKVDKEESFGDPENAGKITDLKSSDK